MELKYVGDLPKVSKHGVSFDHTRPDKYTYLQATAELLEALSYGATETTQHLYNTKEKELSSSELSKLLKKHISSIENDFTARENKASSFVDELRQRVHENDALNEDEKTAWLGNISLMKEYFFQYVANDCVYKASLSALGDEIAEGKIEEVSVPMFKNYAMVLNDLVGVMGQRKAPIDSEVKIEEKKGELIATLHITHR
ncbi:MAG: hypothetical protein U9O86_06380 [Campylobacterota bacterium]|nr:hypothetical protein [Campylobacterota bacterium]